MKLALTVFAAALALPLAAQPLTATPYLTGLSSSVAFVQDPLNPAVQYVVQQGGSVIVFVNGTRQATPFLTLSVTTGSERGLLGLAFPPDHATSGQFYVHWTRTVSGVGVFMQLSRFTKSAGNPLVADPASRLDIIRTLRPFTNHNAGTIAFGPDGYLYIPTGDGGSGGDPGNRGQNPNELLGKMLRLDPRLDDYPVDPDKNYGIPPTNPFLPANNPPISALPEIWAFGLRNPWKIRFDETRLLGTGALLIADVGQGTREEVNYEPFLRGGRNYGWRRWEGTFLHSSSTTLAYEPHRPPIHEYDRSVGQSITGGPVYRGLQLGPEYWGRYFFADYVQGKVFSIGLSVDNMTGEATTTDVVDHSADFGGAGALGSISSIDTDTEGEVYVTALGGAVYRLNRPEHTWLVSVDRTAGVISSGQVRSLVSVDNRVLVMSAFQPTATSPRPTQLVARFQTNRTQRNTVTLSFNARMGLQLGVPSTIRLLNWTTGQYDAIGNVNMNANWQQFDMPPQPAATYVSSTGAILARFDATYTGPLPTPTYSVQYERAQATVN